MDALTSTQQRVVRDLIEFGLIYQPGGVIHSIVHSIKQQIWLLTKCICIYLSPLQIGNCSVVLSHSTCDKFGFGFWHAEFRCIGGRTRGLHHRRDELPSVCLQLHRTPNIPAIAFCQLESSLAQLSCGCDYERQRARSSVAWGSYRSGKYGNLMQLDPSSISLLLFLIIIVVFCQLFFFWSIIDSVL